MSQRGYCPHGHPLVGRAVPVSDPTKAGAFEWDGFTTWVAPACRLCTESGESPQIASIEHPMKPATKPEEKHHG